MYSSFPRSFDEVDIANYLFTHGVEYEYETEYRVRTASKDHRQYTPDFYLPAYDIYIEHFAVNRNGEVPDWFSSRNGKTASQAYTEDMFWKRQLHRENKTKLIETFAFLSFLLARVYEDIARKIQADINAELDITVSAGLSLTKSLAKMASKFRCIIASDAVKYETAPGNETVITFFVIHRHTGLFDIVNVTKTFLGDECVSRGVQDKKGITGARIDMEIANIRKVFAAGIHDATGLVLTWNTLDLSNVMSVKGQVRRIKAWGRVGISAASDIPPLNLN